MNIYFHSFSIETKPTEQRARLAEAVHYELGIYKARVYKGGKWWNMMALGGGGLGYCGPQGSQNGSYWLLSIWSGAGSAGYQGNVPDNPHRQGERSNPSVAPAIELMVSLLNILSHVGEPFLFYSIRASLHS